MSFCAEDIATMLIEYEDDHKTGMNFYEVSENIYEFTSGYPYPVSDICNIIDEKLHRNWTPDGISRAVQIVANEESSLFKDIVRNLESDEQLRDYIYDILIIGIEKKYNPDDSVGDRALMFAFTRSDNGNIVISNKIFEIRMANFCIAYRSNKKNAAEITAVKSNEVLKEDDSFDMAFCLRKFAKHLREIFSEKDVAFYEQHARLIFISYLRPLIYGKGFYHFESALTTNQRMDIVAFYGKAQFIIELKRWYGEKRHEEEFEQLAGYMTKKNAETGYLVTFDFRLDSHRELREEWISLKKGLKIFDVVI
jgi:hypothetical protein